MSKSLTCQLADGSEVELKAGQAVEFRRGAFCLVAMVMQVDPLNEVLTVKGPSFTAVIRSSAVTKVMTEDQYRRFVLQR